ncbi:uncharacterized protein ARMOST_10711 [Armillaria ostoyae]|uniref:Uncharacterized protein n=1 Tax=Armillaria ostoyae TaxID=47428 RepID=A0A284RF38_ARMOS|nr:uncharacterized protein ARMOST_10711 [Armillaria ostoyae]
MIVLNSTETRYQTWFVFLFFQRKLFAAKIQVDDSLTTVALEAATKDRDLMQLRLGRPFKDPSISAWR